MMANRSMKNYAAIVLLLFFSGCAQKRILLTREIDHQPDPRAVGLFVDALNYELNQNFAAALLMYQEALLYDSTSSIIHMNIGKNYLRLGKDESAMLALKRCLELDPDQPEAWDILASLYSSHGWWDLTEKAYLSIISRDSTDESNYHKLAMLYLRIDQKEKAAAVYQGLLKRSPVPNPKILISLGEIYFKLGQFGKSAQYFSELIRIDPHSGFGHFGLGMTCEARQDTLEAIRFYTKAIECAPRLNEARDRLGQIYISKKAWNEAIQIYLDAVQSDTTSLGNWLELGDLYQETGDTLHAEKLFTQIQSRFPEDWQTHLNYGRYLIRRQQYSVALVCFEKVIALSPDNALGWLFGGFTLTHMDSLEKARDYLLKSLAISPQDPMGNYYLGTVYSQLEDFKSAVAPLRRAVEVRPRWISALTSLANAYENLKFFSEADSVFQTALALEPTNALVLNNYSYSLSLRGERIEEALNMALSALKENPENGAYLDTVGWLYFLMGKPEQALSFLEKAVMVHQESYEVYDHLGDVYAALNMPEKAKEAWAQALVLDKDNRSIQKKLSQTF